VVANGHAALTEHGHSIASVADLATDEDIAVRIEQLSHWFLDGSVHPRAVLRNVDLEVRPREFLALVGPSGCGKTTLLNIIGGVIGHCMGRVDLLLNGVPQRLPSPLAGFMQARDALLPWRTVRANVELGLQFRGVPKQQRQQAAVEFLALVGLAGHEHKLPRQLSQGMRQRANLARLLVTRPKLLLMDEPFGALDAQTKAHLQVEFLRLWEERLSTVMFVTHDLAEAALLADRIAVMQDGQIVADVTVPFERPRHADELRFGSQFQTFVRGLWPLLGRQ
jgi:NitT/TauT family transport system ATP-binding protein